MKIDFVDFLQIGAAFWKKQITPRLVTYGYLWTKYERNLMSDCGHRLLDVLQTFTLFLNKKNAVTAASRLACLEIRSRNEKAINSTRNRIYSLKVTYLLTSILFTCFWIDLVRVLATTGNTSAVALIRVYNYTKNQRPQLQRSTKWFAWHVISIIAENKPYAHHKNYLHTMKVYNTRLLLIKILFFDYWVAFTCSKVINAFKR